MKQKDHITIDGIHYELKKADDDVMVCTTCALEEVCRIVSNDDYGLCHVFDDDIEKIRSYHFVKKYINKKENENT